MTSVGIDFGTTNSVVSMLGPSGPEALRIDDAPADWEQFGFGRVMPSVFALSADGTGHFGWSAKLSGQNRFEAVKRLFATQRDAISGGDGTTFAVEEVATMLFAQLRQAANGQGVNARDAVVTVPANSRGLARHRTKICGGMGGFNVLALINEPTAAAMAYAASNDADGQLLVFDWGGGTLDVTVLRATNGVFIEQASKGLPTRGGLDFDSRLRKTIVDSVPDYTSWDSSERLDFARSIELAKIRLSRDESTLLTLPNGDTRKITRQMFEQAVRSLIEESRRPIQQCLADIGARGGIDAVVMVGGTSNIPAVRAFVADVLGIAPATDIDPMTAVADGAAIAAAILTGESDDQDFFVATEHALGTIAADHNYELHFSVLIPRNHKLPARSSHTYTPVHPEQQSVDIRVIEGDPDVALDHPDNVILKEWSIDLPNDPDNPNRAFEITYDYDVDGILHVTVRSELTRQIMLEDDVSHGVTADRRELVSIAKHAQQVVAGDQVGATRDTTTANADPETVQLLQRAHVNVIPFLDDDEAAHIRRLADRLATADNASRAQAKSALNEGLSLYSYLF